MKREKLEELKDYISELKTIKKGKTKGRIYLSR